MMRGESMWHAGGRLEMHASFSPGNLNVNDHLEDPSVVGRITVMTVKETELQDMDWLHFAQDRNEWQAVVNTGMGGRLL